MFGGGERSWEVQIFESTGSLIIDRTKQLKDRVSFEYVIVPGHLRFNILFSFPPVHPLSTLLSRPSVSFHIRSFFLVLLSDLM